MFCHPDCVFMLCFYVSIAILSVFSDYVAYRNLYIETLVNVFDTHANVNHLLELSTTVSITFTFYFSLMLPICKSHFKLWRLLQHGKYLLTDVKVYYSSKVFASHVLED